MKEKKLVLALCFYAYRQLGISIQTVRIRTCFLCIPRKCMCGFVKTKKKISPHIMTWALPTHLHINCIYLMTDVRCVVLILFILFLFFFCLFRCCLAFAFRTILSGIFRTSIHNCESIETFYFAYTMKSKRVQSHRSVSVWANEWCVYDNWQIDDESNQAS